MKNTGVGVSFGALLMRFALGVVFVWAGLAKLLGTTDYSPEQVSTLQAMGVAITTGAPPAAPAAAPVDTAPRPPSKPLPPPVGGGSASLDLRLTRPGAATLAYAAQPPAGPAGSAPAGTVRMRSLYMVAIVLNSASKPPASNPKAMPLVPASIGTGSTPVILAWTASLTEVIGGAFVLVGLLTRLAALSLVGVMAVAAWLTTIGPAVTSGHALLGFLPAAEWYDLQAFTALLMQMTLGLVALAVVFIGPGGASLDAALSGPPSGGSAPKPAKGG